MEQTEFQAIIDKQKAEREALAKLEQERQNILKRHATEVKKQMQ